MTEKAAHSYKLIEEQRDIFESHRHHVFSVAYYMTGDEREAETILQSSFVAAFAHDPRPSIEQLDQSLMEELHQRLSFAPAEPIIADVGEPATGLGGRNVRRTDLEEALWQLPTMERLCFLLRDVEGYANPRVADLLKLTEPEVHRTLFSARLRIRNLLLEQRSADHSNT